MVKLVSVGPFGGNGGDLWDDGVHSMVRRVVILHESMFIRSIQFEYDDSGKAVWSDKHGQDRPFIINTDTVKLDYPDEFLTSVHGKYINNMLFPTFICSLTFKSNYKKTYGPFGLSSSEGGFGKCFSIQMTGHKIVGFHGKCNKWMYLRSLGAYLKPIDDRHQSIEKGDQSKALIHHSSSPLTPSKTILLPGNHTDETKPETMKTDDKPNIQYNVCGNGVSRNEGDHNGTFSIGNTNKSDHYYYSCCINKLEGK